MNGWIDEWVNERMTPVATQANSTTDIRQLSLWYPSSPFNDIIILLASLPLHWKKSMWAKPLWNKWKVEMGREGQEAISGNLWVVIILILLPSKRRKAGKHLYSVNEAFGCIHKLPKSRAFQILQQELMGQYSSLGQCFSNYLW